MGRRNLTYEEIRRGYSSGKEHKYVCKCQKQMPKANAIFLEHFQNRVKCLELMAAVVIVHFRHVVEAATTLVLEQLSKLLHHHCKLQLHFRELDNKKGPILPLIR